MDTPYHIEFDDSKDIETFYDFHGLNIIKVNTTDTNRFLEQALNFDKELSKRLDAKKRCRIIYIADQLPPLSVILKYIDSPVEGLKLGLYAIVTPKDPSLVFKFTETVIFSLPMSFVKHRYILKVFEHSCREDFTPIIKWMDEMIAKKDKDEDVQEIQLLDEQNNFIDKDIS